MYKLVIKELKNALKASGKTAARRLLRALRTGRVEGAKYVDWTTVDPRRPSRFCGCAYGHLAWKKTSSAHEIEFAAIDLRNKVRANDYLYRTLLECFVGNIYIHDTPATLQEAAELEHQIVKWLEAQ